ncbi:tetratricopeptide repeat protein [Nonomuraea fuscirosea]|uniref:tetratricopeptide repeat protein n=1 Tax=Nonomuraea fuscirosea TaxID=1291556 RepID=UPI003712369F
MAALIDRARAKPNPVVRVGVEVAGVDNVDDVVRYRQMPPHLYSQVKYAVDARTAVNGDLLLERSDANGPSILEKIATAWRKLTAEGATVDLSLITNRQLDFADPLVSRHDSRTLLLMPGAGEGGPRSAQGRARRRWAEAAGLSQDELLELLAVLKFDCGFSVVRMRELVAGKMGSVGLPADAHDISMAAAWVEEQVRNGVTEITLGAIDRAVENLWPAAKLLLGPETVAAPLAGATEAGVKERLGLLPSTYRDQVVSTWRDYPEDTWRLVTALTASQPLPTEVAAEWASTRPEWLKAAAPPVQLLAGEFASAYGQARLMADLFAEAVANGAVRGEFWRARAALVYDELGDKPERDCLLAELKSRQLLEPYARAVVLSFSGDRAAALQELEQWTAESGDRVIRALTQVRIMMAAEEPYAPGNLDSALAATASGSSVPMWSAAVAAVRAMLLAVRARLGRAGTWDRDLREATELLLWARDERRIVRVNSADTVAQLSRVLLAQQDYRRLIQVATYGDDGATRAEADHPEVVENLAVAALYIDDLDLARECMQRLSDQAARARVGALLAEAQGEDQSPFWLAAVAAAEDDDQLGQALYGLAQSGAIELPRLEELAARHPEAAEEIRAQAEAAAGRTDQALRNLRAKASTSLTAAHALSRVYGDTGRIDDQVATLTRAARTFGDNSLMLTAAEILIRADRRQEAANLLDDLLARTPSQGASRVRALQMAAKLAADDRRPHDAADLLRNVLEIDPGDTSSRWALTDLLLHRGELDSAWQELTGAPEQLKPATIAQARLWINLHVRRGKPTTTVKGCLELLRRFGEDQEFGASVVTNLIMPGSIDSTVPQALQEEAHREIGRYFDRWPSGPIRRIEATDPADALTQVGELMRPGSERRRHLRDIGRGVLIGKLPMSFLASAAGRSYAEVLITRIGFAIPARHPDPAEHATCLATVQTHADNPIVIDSTAAVVLTGLPADVRDSMMGVFARVATTDTVTVDALAARDVLAMRSTASLAYDEELGAISVDHSTPAEADRLAEAAEALLTLIYRFERVPRPATSAFAFAFEDAPPPLTTWVSAADLAFLKGCALWSDDPILRMLARDVGIPATSTPAILDHLHTTKVISSHEHETTLRRLITAAIGDFPLHEKRLMELAENDRWQPRAVARILARPATWAKPSAMIPLFTRLIAEVHVHQPDTLPAWLYHAVQGAATAMSHRRAAITIAGNLLACALEIGRATPTTAVTLTVAARQALASSADPDEPPLDSPVVACAKALMNIYTSRLPPDLALQVVMSLFSAHQQEDREAVVRVLLTS